jgi:hypothetical protein
MTGTGHSTTTVPLFSAIMLCCLVVFGPGCKLECIGPCSGECQTVRIRKEPGGPVMHVGETVKMDIRDYMYVDDRGCDTYPVALEEARSSDSTVVHIVIESRRFAILEAVALGSSVVTLTTYDFVDEHPSVSWPVSIDFTVIVNRDS